jgi:integrase
VDGPSLSMSARHDPRTGHWYYRAVAHLPDGSRTRLFGVAARRGFPNTALGAAAAEACALAQIGPARAVPFAVAPASAATVAAFVPTYLASSALRNKPSSLRAKEQVLRSHILPRLGHLSLDQVSYAVIEDFTLALSVTPVGNRQIPPGRVPVGTPTLAPKTVNNILAVLHKLLVTARKRGLIAVVPDVDWLPVDIPEPDFLTFDEAAQLLRTSGGQWHTMILVALRTGLRLGELLALRWQDIDLTAGRLVVRQNAVLGIVGAPKSRRPREVPLSDEVRAALEKHDHHRGRLVFCNAVGWLLRVPKVRWELERACKHAGLRQIGWHVLRHTFASHLAMRGASLKVIQELLGHATIQMTMRYAHLSPDVKRDAVNLLDGRARPLSEVPPSARG